MGKAERNQQALTLEIPPGMKHRKTSLSLPADLAVDLNRLAKRLGITQSALVTALLWQAIPDLHSLLDVAPETDDPDSIKRFRGASIGYVLDAVSKFLKSVP